MMSKIQSHENMGGWGVVLRNVHNHFHTYAELLKAKSQIFVDDNEIKGEKSSKVCSAVLHSFGKHFINIDPLNPNAINVSGKNDKLIWNAYK